MWRKLTIFQSCKFSSSEGISVLYSFLQPTVYAPRRGPFPLSQPGGETPKVSKTLDPKSARELETQIQSCLFVNNTDEAWSSFKLLTSNAFYPSMQVSSSLITHLSSTKQLHNLKRAFATTIFLLEKSPSSLSFEAVGFVLRGFNAANTSAPAIALVKSMFRNRFFPRFELWGPILIEFCRKNGSYSGYIQLFVDNCKIALDEKLDYMNPDLGACNAALEGCCHDLESIHEAEKVIEAMSDLCIRPDLTSLGHLAYLYALKGQEEKISELDKLMVEFQSEALQELSPKAVLYNNMIKGYIKSGSLEPVSTAILRALRERTDADPILREETYAETVKGFLREGRIKELAKLVIDSQALESGSSVEIETSAGFYIVNACVVLGFLDKAHSIIDEMDALGGTIGIGVYASILKAYGKEGRTAEAAQIVAGISALGLKLDVSSYDNLIDAAMSSQDFHSAFSLFRDMREARVSDLGTSYLTIMTGLAENNRPELMAAFLDEIVDDPRIKVATHDWNSIIHSFCKLGRLEDARRTFRRMIFLRFQPSEQTYLSLINGYVSVGTYFNVLMLWVEVKKRISADSNSGFNFNHDLVDAFLYAFVKGGFFDAVMQVVEKAQEMKVFVDKWRYKQAFMETHKKLKVQKLRRKNFRKLEALIAFKNWAGLNA